MASDTVPAAVPGPSDPGPGTPNASPQADQPRGLTGLLSAIDPARATPFTLQPTPGDQTGDQAITGGSSADYHDAENPQENGKKNSGGNGTRGQERSVLRAWLLAGAERWKKGGDARLKALDIKKARAQAFQVKESRTVNRAEKFVGGNTSSGTNTQNSAGKSLNNKGSQARKDSSSGPKNHSGAHKNSPSGQGGGKGHGGSGGGAGGRGSSGGSSGRGTDTRKTPDTSPRSSKDSPSGKQHHGKHDTKTPIAPDKGKKHDRTSPGSKGLGGRSNGGNSGTGGGSSKAGAQGAAGKDGKPGKDAPTTPGSINKTPKDLKDRQGPQSAGGPGKPDKPGRTLDLVKKLKPNLDRRDEPNSRSTEPQHGKKPVTDLTKPGDAKKPGTDVQKPKQPPAPAPGSGTGKTPRTQPSREAGYRDGVRAAGAANHVLAYRDGVRDGWKDKREHGRREADQLDHAHTRRKQERQTQPPAQQPQPKTVKVPPMPTHAPTNTTPQPVQVTGIDATHLHLGTGAHRTHISRGEVRTLAGFQRRLTRKADTLTQITERTRALEAHAKAQADKATRLLEQARAVKGGEKLAAALTKLVEAAKVQQGQAAEVRKRAMRGSEACTTVSTNADTRYGGIYQAVVESPETVPAELVYYQELGITHG